jgi:hypothetical protein
MRNKTVLPAPTFKGLFRDLISISLLTAILKCATTMILHHRGILIVAVHSSASALILAYAMLVDHRINAATKGEVGVLRISFLKTLQIVQGLWRLRRLLTLSAALLGPQKVRLLVRRALRQITEALIAPRRKRSCRRGLRQPVSSRPRLRRNTCRKGAIEYSVGEICA